MSDVLQPHIKLRNVDEFCILSGNPDRVPIIASYLEETEKVAEYRGLIAYKGKTKNTKVPVTVLTTGMGTGSSAIVVEEAFKAGARNFFRVGSTGSLNEGIQNSIGSIFIPFGAIRDEGTSQRIVPLQVPAIAHPLLHKTMCDSAKQMNLEYNTGLVWTTDIYYQPDLNIFKKWASFGATCVEMESSFLYTFCASKQFEAKACTILTSDANLNEDQSIYVGETEKNLELFRNGVKNSILITLSAIEKLHSTLQ